MQKEEFVYWCNWLKVRWPNANLSEFHIRSLYDDFAIYNDNVFGNVLLDYFDSGIEFLDWSAIKRRTKDLQIQEYSEQAQQIKALEDKKDKESDPPSSLQAYLKQNGWKSFEEAVYYKTQHLYQYGGLKDWQKENFAEYVGKTYESAKEHGWQFGIGLDEEKTEKSMQ